MTASSESVGPESEEPESAEPVSAADELVEVLSPDGSVLEIVPRRRMRAEGLAHRATFVITVLASPEQGGPTDSSTAARSITDGLLSDRLERWLGDLSWPLLGPDVDNRPALAPPELGPAVHLASHTPLVVHRRADWKDVYPGYWDLAFGGVCSVGERWLESAERELTEEAGLSTRTATTGSGGSPVAVVPVAAGRYVDDRSETFGVLFLAFADREPVPSDGEVVAIERIPLGDIATWAAARRVCPDSKSLAIPVVSTLIDVPGSNR